MAPLVKERRELDLLIFLRFIFHSPKFIGGESSHLEVTVYLFLKRYETSFFGLIWCQST